MNCPVHNNPRENKIKKCLFRNSGQILEGESTQKVCEKGKGKRQGRKSQNINVTIETKKFIS